MASSGNNFWNLIFKWNKSFLKAQQIKKDPTKRQKSIWFGVISSLCAFIGILFGVLFGFSLNGLESDNALANILGWIGLVVGVIGWIGLIIESFIYWSFQVSINKKPFTWISLVLIIIFMVAAVIAAFIISTHW